MKVENPSTTKREDQNKIEEFIYRQFVRLRNVPPELRTTENERVVQQYKQLNIGRSAVPAHIESFKKYRQSEKRKDDQLKVDPGAKGWVYYLNGQTLGVLKAITKKINDQGEMHDRANNRRQRKRIETGGGEGHLKVIVMDRLVNYMNEVWRGSRNSAILEYLKGLATNIQGAKRVNLRDDIRKAKNIAAVFDREIMKDDDVFDIKDKLNDLRPKQRASRRNFGR